MSKIVCEFDTADKKLAVTQDGKKMKDVSEVCFYSYGDNASVEIRSTKYNEDEQTVTVTKIMASDDGDIVEETVKTEAVERAENLASALGFSVKS